MSLQNPMSFCCLSLPVTKPHPTFCSFSSLGRPTGQWTHSLRTKMSLYSLSRLIRMLQYVCGFVVSLFPNWSGFDKRRSPREGLTCQHRGQQYLALRRGTFWNNQSETHTHTHRHRSQTLLIMTIYALHQTSCLQIQLSVGNSDTHTHTHSLSREWSPYAILLDYLTYLDHSEHRLLYLHSLSHLCLSWFCSRSRLGVRTRSNVSRLNQSHPLLSVASVALIVQKRCCCLFLVSPGLKYKVSILSPQELPHIEDH